MNTVTHAGKNTTPPLNEQIKDTASFVAAISSSSSAAHKARAVTAKPAAPKPARGGLAAQAKAQKAAAKAPPTGGKGGKAPKATKTAKAAAKGKPEAAAAPAIKHVPLKGDILKALAEKPEKFDGKWNKDAHVERLLADHGVEKVAGHPLTVIDILDVLDVAYPEQNRRRAIARVRNVIADCGKRKIALNFVDVENKLIP